MIECAKAEDVDGVVDLYSRAVRDSKVDKDILHIAIRACLTGSEGQKASALFAAAQASDMPIAPATVRLVDAIV